MGVYETILARRSVRKFKQDKIDKQLLRDMVRAAGAAPTGANRQILSFGIISDEEYLEKIFPKTAWAGYFSGAYTPAEGERPTAYIAVFVEDKNKNAAEVAAGAAIENLLIFAQDKGIGSCWLGAIKRDELEKILGVSEDMRLIYLVALGYPAEFPTTCEYDGDIKYFINDDGVLTVPKKTLDMMLICDL